MEPKTQEQIRNEVFAEWAKEPGRFSPADIEVEVQRRYEMQFPVPERPQAVPIPPKPSFRLQTIRQQDLLAQPDEEQPWVVVGVVPEEEMTVITGEPGCGKSYISLYLAIHIACGTSAFSPKNIAEGEDAFTGFVVPQAKRVLYIDEENPIRQTRRRLRKMVAGLPADIQKLFATSELLFAQRQGLKIDNQEKHAALKKEIADKKIEVVIIDMLRDIHTSEENSSTEMARAYDLVKELETTNGDQKKKQLTFIILHHNRKAGQFERNGSESPRGSNVTEGVAGSRILVRSEWLSNKLGIKVILTQKKTRDIAPFQAFEAIIEDNPEKTKTEIYFTKFVEEKMSVLLECTDAIVDLIKEVGEKNRKEIIALLPDYSSATKDRALKNLKTRKILSVSRKDRSIYYNINEQEQSILFKENDVEVADVF